MEASGFHWAMTSPVRRMLAPEFEDPHTTLEQDLTRLVADSGAAQDADEKVRLWYEFERRCERRRKEENDAWRRGLTMRAQWMVAAGVESQGLVSEPARSYEAALRCQRWAQEGPRAQEAWPATATECAAYLDEFVKRNM